MDFLGAALGISLCLISLNSDSYSRKKLETVKYNY